jgi:hypothetical protein
MFGAITDVATGAIDVVRPRSPFDIPSAQQLAIASSLIRLEIAESCRD